MSKLIQSDQITSVDWSFLLLDKLRMCLGQYILNIPALGSSDSPDRVFSLSYEYSWGCAGSGFPVIRGNPVNSEVSACLIDKLLIAVNVF